VAATGMVEAMLAAHREDAAPDTVGLLAPVLFDARGTLRQTHWVAGPPLWVPRRRSVPPRSIVDGVFFTIASGSLIPAAALRRIGGMREAFFVDYVDFDFAFRLRAAGLRLVGVGDARLEHRLGEPRTKRLLGREVSVNTHSAIRRRTIYRNRTRLWREYGFRMPGFVAFELASVAIDLAKLALIEDDKIAKLGAIVLGMTDGLFGPSERLRTRVRFDRS
jgi:GT2 family glycosyltransferase